MASVYRILLFDIDGTLVSTGGAGAAAWKRAFAELHGIPADIGEFTDAGMTDPDVGATTFEAVLHREPTPHELAQLMQRRLEYLPEAVADSTGYKVLPGVPERLRQSAATAICSGSSPATATARRTSSFSAAVSAAGSPSAPTLVPAWIAPTSSAWPSGAARRSSAETCRTRRSS